MGNWQILEKLYNPNHIVIGYELAKLSSIQLLLRDAAAMDSIDRLYEIFSCYYGSHTDVIFPYLQFLRKKVQACFVKDQLTWLIQFNLRISDLFVFIQWLQSFGNFFPRLATTQILLPILHVFIQFPDFLGHIFELQEWYLNTSFMIKGEKYEFPHWIIPTTGQTKLSKWEKCFEDKRNETMKQKTKGNNPRR